MLRFTIRDLLWLTVVVAIALGWWADRRRMAAWAESFPLELDHALREQYQHEIDLLTKENAALKSGS